MNETLDGEFQKFSVAGGAYIREHFFGPDPRLRKLVEHLSDDDLAKLRRGGHDYRKVYAAYKAATEHKGAPTVILAQTVKGWTLGPGVEARNITHQAKKLTEAELQDLPRPARAADPRRQAQGRAVLPPGPRLARRSSTCMRAPASARRPAARKRVVRSTPLPAPAAAVDAEFAAGSTTPVSTTMVFARILRNLIRDKELGPRIVPIIPDEARTFGMDPLFKEVGIYAALGQRYEPVDSDLVLSYREATDGQVLEEGITEAGSMASFQAAGTSYATHGLPMIPFYIFYSMFGFQRTGDQIWAFGDARGRGFLMGATAGRTTLDRRGPPARRRPHPDPRLDRPEPARLRPGLRLRAGGDRPRRHRADVRPEARGRLLLRHALQRELRPADEARGRHRRRDPARASTASRRRPTLGPRRAPRPGSSARARSSSRSLAARDLLAEKFGVAAEVYSAPSFQLLRRDALEAERWNRLHPDAKTPRVPYVSARSWPATAVRSSPRPTG